MRSSNPPSSRPPLRVDPETMRTILDVVRQHRRGEMGAADAVNAFYPLLYGVSETVARDRLSRIRSAYIGYVETDGLPEDAMAFAWDCFRSNGWTLPIPKEVCCARQAKDLSRSSTCLLTYSAFYLAVAFSKAPPPGSGSGGYLMRSRFHAARLQACSRNACRRGSTSSSM